MIRIGGGYEPFEIYLKKNGLQHGLRLHKMTEEHMKSVREVVHSVLVQNKVDETISMDYWISEFYK